MRPVAARLSLSLLLLALALALAGAGCSDATGPARPGGLTGTWLGGFSATDTTGTLSLQLDGDDTVRGELVLRLEPASILGEDFLVRGTLTGRALRLELDTGRVPYQYTLTVTALLGDDGSLAGTLTCPTAALAVPFTARRLSVGTLQVDRSVIVPEDVLSMVHDGARLWLATGDNDYLRLDDQGAVQDTVAVTYGDAHWTSGALTTAGDHLLGFLPRVVTAGGRARSISAMLEFDEAGIAREFTLPHRTGGLARDGDTYWSLATGTRRLYRFDLAGTVLDSLDTDVPDACHLEFDGTSFWTVSWYTLRLYELDASGRAVAVYDPPLQEPRGLAAGLACDGQRLWYAHTPGQHLTRVLGLSHSRS